MAALFACTKCHSRFPFEDLSHGDQLCKDCRSQFPVVKCTFCRIEFQLNNKGSSSTVCEKCSQNVRVYGKPKACEYCSVLAAFIGKRCQRCVNSEKKWGPPVTCEQCKLKCAFNRRDGSKKKVDGKLLCWLCTQAYKRVLAKTRNAQDLTLAKKKSWSGTSLQDPNSQASGGEGSDDKAGLAAAIMRMASSNTKPNPSTPTSDPILVTSAGATVSSQPPISSQAKTTSGPNGHSHQHHHRSSSKHSHSRSLTEKSSMDRCGSMAEKGGVAAASSGGGEGVEGKEGKHHRSRSHHHHHHHHHHDRSKHRHSKHQENPQNKEETEEGGPSKKPRLDKVLSNGVSTPKSTGSNASDSGAVDMSSSENMIMITQLREQIESLKKQMMAKDAQLLEKDKRINELKAENYEAEKEARTKVQNLQKQHEETVSNLQIKNRELQRQVTRLSKGVKKSVLDAITNSG